MADKHGEEESWELVHSATWETSPAPAPVAIAEEPGHLRIEYVLEHPNAPLERCEFDAVLSVIAPAPAEGRRARLHLVAVLDKSGSMGGNKIQLVIRTMRFMVQHLSEQDALGLVAYDSQVTVLAPLTRCDEHGRQLLLAALDGLRAGSATNLSGGLLRGLELHGEGLRQTESSQRFKRVRFGNTYRRLTEAEAEARKRDAGSERRRPPASPRVHEWSMELRLEEEDVGLVRMVVYKLREETFPEARVEMSESPWRITRLGWGSFTVRADVYMQDGSVLNLSHDLQFGVDESFHWVLLPVAVGPPAATSGAERLPEDSERAIVRSAFLFTDGLANNGITEAGMLREAFSSALDALGSRRCTLSTFGFGADHDADLLTCLAEVGRGSYCYVDSEEKIAEAFGEAFGGLLSTTHQNVRLRLDLEPGVKLACCHTAHPVTGPEQSSCGGQRVEVDFGDLFAEERRDVLVTLELDGVEAPGATCLGRLSTKGFCLQTLRPEEHAAQLLELQRCNDAINGIPEPLVERQRQRQLVVVAMEAARAAAGKGAFDEAKAQLRAALDRLASSDLAAQGDMITQELLRDLEECLAGLRSQEEYRNTGSKVMTSKQRAHAQQRSVGIEDTLTYTTGATITMRAAFKEEVHR